MNPMQASKSDSVKKPFSGTVPLFPLAHPTLFPTLVQPFQVFEPRYRALASSALAGQKLIAMAVLRPHWELKYESKSAPIYPFACLGKITIDQKLPDGRFLLVLQGLCRAEIMEEIDSDDPFRIAQVQERPDVLLADPSIDREHRRIEMLDLFQKLFPGMRSQSTLLPLFEENVSFSAVCDLIAFALQLPPAESYALLAEANVDLRSELVLQALKDRVRAQHNGLHDLIFPPAFSAN